MNFMAEKGTPHFSKVLVEFISNGFSTWYLNAIIDDERNAMDDPIYNYF